jgi:hypothetical protein
MAALIASRLLALLVQALALCRLCTADVVVAMSSNSTRADNKVRLLSFCLNCPSPRVEGSAAYGLLPRHGLQEFAVEGALVTCLPNSAESKKILNPSQVKGRIVLVDRGRVPLVEKVKKLHKAGALGILVADDGRCRYIGSYM